MTGIIMGRKTTNRLRAIETALLRQQARANGGVARQLIAFGRLKLWWGPLGRCGCWRRKATNRLRAIETHYRIRTLAERLGRKTTNRLRAIETNR